MSLVWHQFLIGFQEAVNNMADLKIKCGFVQQFRQEVTKRKERVDYDIFKKKEDEMSCCCCLGSAARLVCA